MAKFTIGLDIGGTKITGVVSDGVHVVRELTVATPKTIKEFKLSLVKLLSFLSTGREIFGVGVGVAGIVNSKKGSVTAAPNVKMLSKFNLVSFIKEQGYGSVVIENDANCFALAESVFGKGKIYENFIGITLGTGIGGGIIVNKQLYSGSHGSAGEVGHGMADFKNDSEHYFQKARDKKDMVKMGEVLGLLFANVFNILDIEAIVLGGTVASRHGKQFLPTALKIAKKHVLNKSGFPKVVVSTLKNSAAVGAALLVK